MGMNMFRGLLLLLLLSSTGTGFGRKRAHKDRLESEETLCKPRKEPLAESNAVTLDHHNDCSLAEFGIVQKIPYLHTCSTCDATVIDFSSVCVSCGKCLAIAEEINKTLLEVHELMPQDSWLNDTEVDLLLRTICDHSFKNHCLQEIDGKRFLSGRVAGSTLINTSADGLWGKNLKDTCHHYLDEFGEARLYEYWRKWCETEDELDDLATTLCRSEIGILRDCKSMEDVNKYESPFSIYEAKMKISATYG